MTLDREDVEAVALRVVELLEERAVSASSQALVDARAVARRLGVSRDFVYAHAVELGGRRVGDGPKPRLLFDLVEVDRRMDSGFTSRQSGASEPAPVQGSARRRRRPLGSGVDLLPVRRGPR